MADKIVSQIYETRDYDKFTPLVQNRGTANKQGIKQSKLKKLARLFETGEWVPELGVIKVNKELKVIDGHHRLALLRAADLPVWYQIVEHEKFNEVTTREFLNNTFKGNQQNTAWTNNDFFKAAVQSKAPLALRIQQIIQSNMNTFGYGEILALLKRDALLFRRVSSDLKDISTFEDKELIDYSESAEFKVELESFIKINNKLRIAPYRDKLLSIVYDIIFNARIIIDPLNFRKSIPSIPDRVLQSTKGLKNDDTLRIFLKHYNTKFGQSVRVESVQKSIRENKAKKLKGE